MNALYFRGNRQRLYDRMAPGSILVMFSGREIWKTGDENYPFFAERNFVYLTGLSCKEAVLLAAKDGSAVAERLYILPKDPMAERWTGRRYAPYEAEAISGIRDVRTVETFAADFAELVSFGAFEKMYLDLEKLGEDGYRPVYGFAAKVKETCSALTVENAGSILRDLRLIKQPCEIEALHIAEKKTKAGILAMMKASRPGMYEYRYKAEFDRALGQFGPEGPGFPSIISAGQNNFCIHYYGYTGRAQDGDMVLNDVGGQHENMITDVSRGWPCNGRFTEKQKLLYECALATSDYMFSIIRPGMRMEDVDGTIRRYNFERMKDAGVLDRYEDIGTYMWHGGAHHIGYDVHDVVTRPEILQPGMAFCVDVGIYHEAWGIGFRLEDNCLITETGCENLSREIPRTVEEIESVMGTRF